MYENENDFIADITTLKIFNSNNKIYILGEFQTETCRYAKSGFCIINPIESNKLLNWGTYIT